MMMNLKQARDAGKLDQFIEEREAEQAPAGDEKALNRALTSMVRTSKEAPAASKKRRSDG